MDGGGVIESATKRDGAFKELAIEWSACVSCQMSEVPGPFSSHYNVTIKSTYSSQRCIVAILRISLSVTMSNSTVYGND